MMLLIVLIYFATAVTCIALCLWGIHSEVEPGQHRRKR